MISVDGLAWSLPCCPAPPTWSVDWPAILAAYPWLRSLDGVPQSPVHHAEGDVLIHTRLVAEALAAMPAWRALPDTERAVLFAAALLHDIGKPGCTQVEPDGHISTRGHARAGASSTRHRLWTREGLGVETPFAVRETITALVRLHGLPLWFLEREDIDRALFTASYRVRLDRVALLAEADARGRACRDKAELLDRIELFRETCREHNCLDHPRPFSSDHTRVCYFRGIHRDPDYDAYDDTWGEVVLLAGLPGAGKDTWLRDNLPDRPVLSLDAIRRELDIDPKKTQGRVVHSAKQQARELLRDRRPLVWNATNLTRRMRDPLIDLFLAYGARVRIVYLDSPLDVLLRRNRARPAAVPEPVIRRLADKLELPDLTEAHRVEYGMAGLERGSPLSGATKTIGEEAIYSSANARDHEQGA